MSGRDPRVQPRAGDCICLAGQERYVSSVDPAGYAPQYVHLAHAGYPGCPTYPLQIAGYRRWASGAEVVRVAGEE